ncbi:hypothetical protein PVAP13_7KG126555, partial [Panicum virgatum]
AAREGENNVILTTERLCELNQQDLIYGTTTITTVSFRAILVLVLEKLDLTYMGGEPFFTRGLKFQAKLTFYTANQFNTLLFDIYSCECEYIIRKRRRVHSSVL